MVLNWRAYSQAWTPVRVPLPWHLHSNLPLLIEQGEMNNDRYDSLKATCLHWPCGRPKWSTFWRSTAQLVVQSCGTCLLLQALTAGNCKRTTSFTHAFQQFLLRFPLQRKSYRAKTLGKICFVSWFLYAASPSLLTNPYFAPKFQRNRRFSDGKVLCPCRSCGLTAWTFRWVQDFQNGENNRQHAARATLSASTQVRHAVGF